MYDNSQNLFCETNLECIGRYLIDAFAGRKAAYETLLPKYTCAYMCVCVCDPCYINIINPGCNHFSFFCYLDDGYLAIVTFIRFCCKNDK